MYQTSQTICTQQINSRIYTNDFTHVSKTPAGFTRVIFPHRIPCAHKDLHRLQQVNHETYYYRIYTRSIVSMGPTDINLVTFTAKREPDSIVQAHYSSVSRSPQDHVHSGFTWVYSKNTTQNKSTL